jgi:pimeloyl-ACP methyl ester carboxylesterase
MGDIKLSVRQEGQGPPLLFVHGFPLDHTMWNQQIVEFGKDYHVIAPDLRGFGASELGSDPVSMAKLADDLAAMLSDLQITRPVVFCGLSMGGYVGWQFWDRHASRLDKLILCDTRAAADSAQIAEGRRDTATRILEEGAADLIETMLPRLFAETTTTGEPTLIHATRGVMESTDVQTIAAALLAMAERPDFEARLPEIGVSTLLLCGEHDQITPVAEMQQVAAAMPNAQFVEIGGAGHMSPMEQPVAVNRAIRQFLETQG